MPAPTYPAALARLAEADPEALAVVHETLAEVVGGEPTRRAHPRDPEPHGRILADVARRVDEMVAPLVVAGMWSRPALATGIPEDFNDERSA
jgi:hypothetical protein